MIDDTIDPATAFTNALIPDLPLMQYSSGDVHPTLVDPATTELIAHLTAEYVEKLVKAAVDAHDILTDGAGGLLPPPSYKKRPRDDWDDELPMPNIKNSGDGSLDGTSQSTRKHDEEEEFIKGVDIYANRIRSAHTSVSSVIGPQSFVFPICHDAEIYNKVKENKAFKRQVDATLLDSGIMDLIREEKEEGDHLTNSMFHWVHATVEEGEEVKVSNEMESLAKRKELARRLASRTGLDVKMPGVEECLVPMHRTDVQKPGVSCEDAL